MAISHWWRACAVLPCSPIEPTDLLGKVDDDTVAHSLVESEDGSSSPSSSSSSSSSSIVDCDAPDEVDSTNEGVEVLLHRRRDGGYAFVVVARLLSTASDVVRDKANAARRTGMNVACAMSSFANIAIGTAAHRFVAGGGRVVRALRDARIDVTEAGTRAAQRTGNAIARRAHDAYDDVADAKTAVANAVRDAVRTTSRGVRDATDGTANAIARCARTAYVRAVRDAATGTANVVVSAETAFVLAANAASTKVRMATVGIWKYESRVVVDDDGGERSSASSSSSSSHACFKIVPLGHRGGNMIVRLPRDIRSTFRDLRREIEEDYIDDLPFRDFKFATSYDGIAVSVSPAREGGRRIYDFVRKIEGGGDGTYEDPHVVYIKCAEVESFDEE